MARSFYLGSRLRRYMYGNQFGSETEEMSKAILNLVKHADSLSGSGGGGSLGELIDMAAAGDEDLGSDDDTPEGIYATICSYTALLILLGDDGKFVRRVECRGLILTTADFSPGHSHVFLKQPLEAIHRSTVFQIQKIIRSTSNNEVQLLLKRFCNSADEDRYAGYPLLRAKTWQRVLSHESYVVDASDVRCHAAIWNFSDSHCAAIVLDRVRSC